MFNNPLSNIDPSGYFSIDINLGDVFKAIFVIAVVVVTGGMAAGFFGTSGFWAAAASGALVGFASSAAIVLVNGGSPGDALSAGLKGAAIGAVSAGLFHGAGTILQNTNNVVLKAATHGVVGGTRSVLSGGKFQHGFFSGAFTKSVAEPIDSLVKGGPFNPVKTALSAVAGGTAEALGGGKFSNGAVTGAFSRMYNDGFHTLKQAADGIEVDVPKGFLDHLDEFSTFLDTLGPTGAFVGLGVKAPRASLKAYQLAKSLRISRAVQAIRKYLGPGAYGFPNKKHKDLIMMSEDGLRKVRFDVKNLHRGSKGPHMHIEKKVGEEWVDATEVHQIYPKGN